MDKLSQRAIQRDDRNDATEMLRFSEQGAAGLTPAQRVLIAMDGQEIEPLGRVAWNQRQDLISAAPER